MEWLPSTRRCWWAEVWRCDVGHEGTHSTGGEASGRLPAYSVRGGGTFAKRGGGGGEGVRGEGQSGGGGEGKNGYAERGEGGGPEPVAKRADSIPTCIEDNESRGHEMEV